MRLFSFQAKVISEAAVGCKVKAEENSCYELDQENIVAADNPA